MNKAQLKQLPDRMPAKDYREMISGSKRHGRAQYQDTLKPQRDLFLMLSDTFDDCEWEYAGAVPGRRFKIDIAFVDLKVAIELDGWAFHAKHHGDWVRDKTRQNLLVAEGWCVLRYTAKQVRDEMDTIIAQVTRCRQIRLNSHQE